ncbi:MAG: SpoIVB peptidase [Clostridia bacterium]|nr:SpoIVB peptidase [Clostridia bacterium]
MRRVISFVWILAALLCGSALGTIGYYQQTLPDHFTVGQGQEVCVGSLVKGEVVSVNGESVSAAAVRAGEQYRARLELAGWLPLKEVTVSVTEDTVVTVCGIPFGIKLYTDGVLVVDLSDVTTAVGNVNPAAAAGVCVGDVIVAINGQKVNSSEEVADRINACGGGRITLRLRRDGVEFDATFAPVRPAGESGYRAGMWVRDSAAGVGTLTFYDPASGVFGGLGHAMCDVDTGGTMPLAEGEIVPARIFGIKKGQSGKPGELRGCFEYGTLGQLQKNGDDGLYGTLAVYPLEGQSLPVARRQQVQTGGAQILTTLDGMTPKAYDVVIEQVRYSGLYADRHMVIRVTDPDLLTLAGGIVQGMSGSPIIQNGKLVGAVTHVLVDDPTKGYAIFAETMLETAQSVSDKQLKEAS